MKNIAIIITTVILAYSQTISEPSEKDEMHLYIYHPSKAFIEETREVVFSTKGNNLLKINNLPLSTNPKSIMVQSSKFETKTKEFVYNPITQNTLLKSYLGKEITVEKYNDNGKAVYSKTAKLISFNDKPIFNIDGEIITSSAFEFIFPEIPNSLNDIPYLLLNGNVTKKKTDITFSYIANQFGWSADYDLMINSDDDAEISGWYNIWNHSNLDYNNVDVSLISGDINQIPSRQQGGRGQLKSTSFLENNSQRDDFGTDTQKLDDYIVYNIDNPISLPSGSEKQIIFIEPKELQVKKTYHFNHSLQRRNPKKEKLNPALVRIAFKSKEVSDYHLPAGLIKVYERQNDRLFFVGSDDIGVTHSDTDVILNIGKTADIVAEFITEHYEHSRNQEEFTISAKFKNSKEKSEMITWRENVYGDWEVVENSHDYKKINATTIEFILTVPAKSEIEESFTIEINRK